MDISGLRYLKMKFWGNKMWKLQVIEFMQSKGLIIVIAMAFVCALSVSGYWVAKPYKSKTSILGVIFSIISLFGVIVMAVNLKIGLAVAIVGFVAKSILLVRKGYGVGSFLRPALYFKKFEDQSDVLEEDVLDLF